MSVPTAIETTAGESLVELKKNKHLGTTRLKPSDPVHPVWKAGQLTDPDDPKPLYDDFWIREIFNGKSKTIFENRPDFEAANDDPKVWETEFGRIEQYYESVGGKVFSYNRRFVLNPTKIEQTVEDGWASDTLYGVVKELNENIAKALVVDDLKHHLDEIDSLDVLKEPRNLEVLHEHERYRSLVTQMWKSQHGDDPEKSHLWGSLVKEKPTTFEIQQFPQGFFVIPRLYNGHICRVIDDELKERDLGKFSLSWRGFIVEPENFSEVTELIGPLYVDTPGVEL